MNKCGKVEEHTYFLFALKFECVLLHSLEVLTQQDETIAKPVSTQIMSNIFSY